MRTHHRDKRNKMSNVPTTLSCVHIGTGIERVCVFSLIYICTFTRELIYSGFIEPLCHFKQTVLLGLNVQNKIIAKYRAPTQVHT